MGDDHGAVEEAPQIGQQALEGRLAADERGVDAGDAGDKRRDRDARLSQAFEAILDDAVFDADGGDFHDSVVLGAAASSFEIHHHERDMCQRWSHHRSGQSFDSSPTSRAVARF